MKELKHTNIKEKYASLEPSNKETNGHLYILNDNIVRIADALEEILRLVKKDQEDSAARQRQRDTE